MLRPPPQRGPGARALRAHAGPDPGPGVRAPAASVVIVEDHVALRKGVELLIRARGHKVIGVAGDAAEALRLIPRRRPDVALVDIGLPDESGIVLATRLLREDPDLGILLYTGLDDQEVLRRGLDCGARGFALKAGAPEELMAAIERVAAGHGYVDPRLEPLIFNRATTERIGVLSNREREVLALLAEGMTGEEIARRLFLSPETVRTHLRNTMEKLEAQTRAHAIAIALRLSEIEL